MRMKRQLYLPLLITLLASLVFGFFPLGQPVTVYAADTGARYPATVTTTAAPPYDDIDWTTPANVGADDDAYAIYTGNDFDLNSYMYRLDATNFGFTIPAGATIDGIVLEFERSNKKNSDALVQLIKAGTPQGTNKSAGAAWAASDTIVTFGTSTDLWGLTWTPDDINATNFGVAVSPVSTGNNAKPQIDFLRITVYYTPLPSISNTPDNYGFGVVAESSATGTGLDYFTVTNNSGYPVNITISATDMTGGVTWELSEDGSAGSDICGLKAGTPTLGDYTIAVPEETANTLVSNLSNVEPDNTQKWGLQLLAPDTFTGGGANSGTVTLTATAV